MKREQSQPSVDGIATDHGKTLACWYRRVEEREPAYHRNVLAARTDHLHEWMVSGSSQPCGRGEHWLIQYRQWHECVWYGISGQSLSSGRVIDQTGADLWPNDDEGPHRVSAVSDEETKAEETGDSSSDTSEGDCSGDTNPDFESGESAARDPPNEQERAMVATLQRASDEHGQKGGQR